MTKISACLMVQEEEENIRGCLESIKDVVGEIVVVDSYSKDKTVDIAREYTEKVYFNQFENDFAKQRNVGLSKALGDWILVIDADERLSPELQREIPRLIATKKYQGYFFPRKNYIDSQRWLKHGLFYPDYQLRLFRKGIKYKGKNHARPDLDKKFTQKTNLNIIHNCSHTKYDKFSSIVRLKTAIKSETKEILQKEKIFLLYPFTGFFKFFKYFFKSFILKKGFLDGWAGFRATVIFSFQFLAPYFLAFSIKLRRRE